MSLRIRIRIRQLLTNTQALTTLEVILASVILTIASMVLMQFIHTGDKIYGRSQLLRKASILARNEAEIIKAQAPLTESIEEVEYEKQIDKRTFIIKRTVMDNDSLQSLAKNYPVKEIVIQVIDPLRPDTTLAMFKFLQGYHTE